MEDVGEDAKATTPDVREGDASKDAKGGGRFGGMTPSEAASLRWARERARKAESETLPTDAEGYVRVPVQDAAIVMKLSADAAKGSVHAARELRAWQEKMAREDTELGVTSWPRERRALLLAYLNHEDAFRSWLAEQEDAASVDDSVGNERGAPLPTGELS